jgi:hypothetical protein
MHLIVHMYPDPAEQAKAVTAFGGMGAIGTGASLLFLFLPFLSHTQLILIII